MRPSLRFASAAPIDAGTIQDAYTSTLWELIRGASKESQPSARVVGRRLAEVLGEGVGQPGFWELMIVASDLDTQSDVVATMLQEPYRHDFIAPRPGRERRAEVVDLAGAGREHGVEVMAAALVPPVCTEPYGLRFAPDEFWKGETHRIIDRPGAVVRLLTSGNHYEIETDEMMYAWLRAVSIDTGKYGARSGWYPASPTAGVASSYANPFEGLVTP